MPKNKKSAKTEVLSTSTLLEKVKAEFGTNQSYLNLVLGLIIVLVAGVLVFNYFKKDQASLGPSQQTTSTNQVDVEPNNLPGKYTVKEGDTLFTLAEKYYQDGFKFPKLAEVNKLTDVNTLLVGQVLDIPKLEEPATAITSQGTGGAINQTIWGEQITGDTYTVTEGDWLSTIAGRAYGDVMAYEKIAQANNIADPNLIEPGTVLKIPR